jgi:hypothetical protein
MRIAKLKIHILAAKIDREGAVSPIKYKILFTSSAMHNIINAVL